MMLRSSLSRAYMEMLPAIDYIIFEKYRLAKPVYKQIFNIRKTNLPLTYTDSFSGLGLLQEKNEGQAGALDRVYQMYQTSFVPATFDLTIQFTEEAIEDDRLGIVKKAAAAMGSVGAATPDVLAAKILNTGFTTTGPDGKVLFATDHPIIDGTASNRPTNGTDFSFTTLGLALVDWANNQKNARGLQIEVEPRYLVHHPTIMLDVGEVLKSTLRSDTANNTTNIIKSDYDLVPVTWKRLSDPDAWFLIAPQDQHDLNVYVRRSFYTKHGVDERIGMAWTRGVLRQTQGWSAWEGTWGSPGA